MHCLSCYGIEYNDKEWESELEREEGIKEDSIEKRNRIKILSKAFVNQRELFNVLNATQRQEQLVYFRA